MENTTKKLNLAIGVVFIAAAGILVYFAALRPDSSATDASKTPADISAATTDAVYGQLNGLTEIKLAENFESWTPEAKLQPDKTVSRRFAIQGQVDRAYLLVKASEGSNSLTKWDSFYFKLNDTGGHLFRPLSLTVPAGEGTTLLYDLKQVPVLASIPYDEGRTPEIANLLAVLQPGRTALVTSFISSLRQGEIDQLSLYYACASASDCKLELK